MVRLQRSVALGLVFVIAACTSSATPAPTGTAGPASSAAAATATPDNRRVELTFALWAYEGTIKEEYDKFITEFLAQEKRVTKINVDFTPFARYHDVMNVKLASGAVPDMAHIAFNLAPVYIDAGTLLDLKPTLSAFKDYDYADLRPSSLEPWTKDSKVYGIPFTNSTNVMYYNADIFTKAGVKNPDEMIAANEYTWENVRKAAKAIVDKAAGRFGYVFGNNIYSNGWRILEDIWTPYGGGPWSKDGKTCTFNSPETIAGTQLVWDMIYTDKSHPAPGTDVDFFAGDIGMGLYRPSQAGKLANVKYKWGIARQPSGPKGYVPADATNGFAVFKDSKNADLAAAFVAFTTAKEQARRMGRNFPSPRLSLQDAKVLKEVNPIMSEKQIQDTVVAALGAPNASWGYSHKNWGPLESNAKRVFDGSVWKRDANVGTALNQVCSEITALLG